MIYGKGGAVLYEEHRPPNAGVKPQPVGKDPTCLKNTKWILTGTLDSLWRQDAVTLIKSYGGDGMFVSSSLLFSFLLFSSLLFSSRLFSPVSLTHLSHTITAATLTSSAVLFGGDQSPKKVVTFDPRDAVPFRLLDEQLPIDRRYLGAVAIGDLCYVAGGAKDAE